MPKKNDKRKGKQRLPVIDNLVYSNLIFQIALGNNYSQKIFEAFNKEKPASVISRQLDILENKEGFVKSEIITKENVFPMQRLRIYSIRWDKIIEELLKTLEKQRDKIKSQSEALKSNWERVMGIKMQKLDLLQDNDYTSRLKRNSYLIDFLNNYFSELAKVSRNYTIADAFGYMLFFGELDFAYSSSPNLAQALHYLESQNQGYIPKNVLGISKKDWKEIDMKRFNKMSKENLKQCTKDMKDNTETTYERAENRLKDILKRDNELSDLVNLSLIFSCLRFELVLQVILNQVSEKTANKIFERNLSKEEINRINQFNFVLKMPRESLQKKSPEAIRQEELKAKIKETMREKGIEATKSTENSKEKSRDTHQNKSSTTEKGDKKDEK